MRILVRPIAASIGASFVIVFLVGLGCGDGAPTPAANVTTVEEAYEALLGRLRGRQSVLHTMITTEFVQGDEHQQQLEKDLWLDAGRGAGRQEYVLSPDFGADIAEQGVTIFDDRYAFVPDDPDEALRQEADMLCPGSESLLVSVLLECVAFSLHALNADAAASLETGVEYEGTPGIALVFQGENETGSTAFTSRVYLDAETLLPIARVTRASSAEGELEVVSRFEHEFVSRDSLAAGFLDPRSIGYGVEDASQQLDRIESEVPVYWLGEDVDLAGTEDLVLARLEIQLTFPPDEAPYPEGRVYGRHLYYETPSGVPGVYIFLWTPAEWQRYVATPQGQFLSDEACAPSEPISVAGTDGVLYDLVDRIPPIAVDNPMTDQERCEKKIYELWLIPYERIAVLEFEDVVVDMRSDVVGYFDERAPFEAVLAALHRR